MYVQGIIGDFSGGRYLSFEFDNHEASFCTLGKEEKLKLQRECRECLCGRIPGFEKHVISVMDPEEDIFGASLLFVPGMLGQAQTVENFMEGVKRTLDQKFPYGILGYEGERVDSLDRLSESFQSVRVTRCMHRLADEDAPKVTKEEASKGKIVIDKRLVDELIYSVRNNDAEGIKGNAGRIFQEIREKNRNLDFINASIYYVIYRLMVLVEEFDGEMNQQEVIEYISGESFGKMVSGGAKEFTRFILSYADYLAQVRSTEKQGILRKVEAYTREHYDENLSLKYLGEKFYN